MVRTHTQVWRERQHIWAVGRATGGDPVRRRHGGSCVVTGWRVRGEFLELRRVREGERKDTELEGTV